MSAFAYSISLSNNWFAGKASAPFFGWRGGYAGLSLCPTEFSLNCELVTDFGVSSRVGKRMRRDTVITVLLVIAGIILAFVLFGAGAFWKSRNSRRSSRQWSHTTCENVSGSRA